MTDKEKISFLRAALYIALNDKDCPIRVVNVCKNALDETNIIATYQPADIPFDLAAAKRGEKVQVIDKLTSDKWFDVGYIGETSKGDIVIEYLDGKPQLCSINLLRMAPKEMLKLKIQAVVWPNGEFGVCMHADAGNFGEEFIFLGDPIEIQVPDTRF